MSSCKIYTINDANMLTCSENISHGGVVIFPTETVYGIGASALNVDAIQKIYQIKNRPSNNPLIMHILNWQGGRIYTELNSLETSIVDHLTNTFWPGPLTILVKKSSYVLDVISANTEWVALRSPKHPVIRKLIEKSMVPIVAPSANISGKITSTYKDHVLRYFKHTDVSILIDENPSTIGIESTIVKINNNQIKWEEYEGSIDLDIKKEYPYQVDFATKNNIPRIYYIVSLPFYVKGVECIK